MTEPAFRLDEAEVRRKVASLPALPPLVAELLASFQHDDVDVATLARRIAADQGLLVRTLRIANSPFYGLAGQVVSIDDAILVLGFRTVRALVLGAGIVGAFRHQACAGFRPEMFWRHSVAVAVAARALARVQRSNPESAFTAGLLHDIGRYVLALCFPEPFQQVLLWQRTHDCPHLEAERSVLGMDHTQVGAVLAQVWNLPEALVQGIRLHHHPAEDAAVDVVHFAEILAHALELGHEQASMVPPIDPLACERLALDAEQLRPLLAQIETEFEEACNALLS